MGPTGVGKTDLAVELVSRLPLEIISVDSAMVYRRMDIGTGKPEPSVRAAAPHHLLDVREPHESYSAADFRSDALQAIAEIRSRGRIPFLVGGTGLYFRALHDGLSPLPSADPALRNRLAEQAAASDWAALHRRLEKVDPVTAARIHPRDAQRIQRGLEVFELTGRTMSELQRQPPMGDSSAETGRLGRVVSLALEPALRSRLHQRIQIRFERMLALGLLDEVRELRRDPRLSADLSSMRAVWLPPGLGASRRRLCLPDDGRARPCGDPTARQTSAHLDTYPDHCASIRRGPPKAARDGCELPERGARQRPVVGGLTR